jgi:hypothetical protein
MEPNNAGVYEQMKDTFDNGNLVGDAMLKCLTLVENSASDIFDKEVKTSSPSLFSKIFTMFHVP